MNQWIMDNWLALVLGLLAVATTIWGVKRGSTHRAKLNLMIESTRLLASGELTEKLEVTYENRVIEDPHLTTLWIKNAGSKDIPSSAFDGSKDLLITIKGKIFQIIDVDAKDGDTPELTNIPGRKPSEETLLQISPQLIPQGTVWVVKFLSAGESKILRHGNLVDTKISQVKLPQDALYDAAIDVYAYAMPWPFRNFGIALLEHARRSKS